MKRSKTSTDASNTVMRTGFLAQHKIELAIVFVFVLVAAGTFLFTHGGPSFADAEQGKAGSTSAFAVIQNTEGAYYATPLNQDAEFAIETSEGVNRVVIERGVVSIQEADCKNQICVQTGSVGRVGDTIVCLPHKLVVQVVQTPEDASPLKGLLG